MLPCDGTDCDELEHDGADPPCLPGVWQRSLPSSPILEDFGEEVLHLEVDVLKFLGLVGGTLEAEKHVLDSSNAEMAQGSGHDELGPTCGDGSTGALLPHVEVARVSAAPPVTALEEMEEALRFLARQKGTFDTFGLCSYEEPMKAPQEMARVCKSDPLPAPTIAGGTATGTAISDDQAPSGASSAGSSDALKGPGGGVKPRKANWKDWQRDILNKEYAADRNPSRETVECIVARLEQTMTYRQASLSSTPHKNARARVSSAP
jgi:hypothetical protein